MNITGNTLRSTKPTVLEGEAIVTDQPITLLGFVDAKTGKIVQHDHELFNQTITNKIFVFPKGVGSTVGPYVLINLKKNEKHPLAIVNRESDQGTIAGCSIAKIPLVYNCSVDPIKVIKSGDKIKINITSESTIITRVNSQ
jgi:uncharacterized protein